LKKLTLAEAIEQATDVLVVAPARPATRTVSTVHPYVDRKTGEKKTMTLVRTLHRFKLVRRLGSPPAHASKPGEIVEVLDSNSYRGEMVQMAMVTTGSWPILFVPQLEGQANPAKGGRFVLLLSGYDAKEKHHLGVGGLGLLPIERQAEVARLLAKKNKRR
jgi:hypothetical protein